MCDVPGYAGQAMTLTVADGACSVPGEVEQISPIALDAPGKGNDGMCDVCAEYSLEVGARGGDSGADCSSMMLRMPGRKSDLSRRLSSALGT